MGGARFFRSEIPVELVLSVACAIASVHCDDSGRIPEASSCSPSTVVGWGRPLAAAGISDLVWRQFLKSSASVTIGLGSAAMTSDSDPDSGIPFSKTATLHCDSSSIACGGTVAAVCSFNNNQIQFN